MYVCLYNIYLYLKRNNHYTNCAYCRMGLLDDSSEATSSASLAVRLLGDPLVNTPWFPDNMIGVEEEIEGDEEVVDPTF